MTSARGQDIWVSGAWHSGAPYSPAIRRGDHIYLSGAVPIDPATGATVGDDIETQTAQVLDNLAALLVTQGCTLDDVVKVNVYLTDSTLAGRMNTVYSVRFEKPYPARSTVQVGPLARPEYLIEVEAIAIAPS